MPRTRILLVLSAMLVAGPLAAQEATPPRADSVVVVASVERPQLINRARAVRSIVRLYPPPLREANITGTAAVTMLVGPDGTPSEVRIASSSGTLGLDQAAVQVGAELRFRPAKVDGVPVTVRVQIPITFSADASVGAPNGVQDPDFGSARIPYSPPPRVP